MTDTPSQEVISVLFNLFATTFWCYFQLFKHVENDSSHSFIQTTVVNPNAEEILKNYQRTPNDTNDPSYSRLTLP